MQYKYETVTQDYSDLSSGRVFYSMQGHPAFPVRLSSEIFQRCLEHRETIYHDSTPCTLYDPCCGAAYHLSVLAYLHGKHIREVHASDVDEKAVDVAKRNLGLLRLAGLDQRIDEISDMLEKYKKESHRDALKSAHLIRKQIEALNEEYPVMANVFQANATDGTTMLQNIKAGSVDIVFTDVPYGQHSQWTDSDRLSHPLWSMLDALIRILLPSNIVAISSDKGQKVSHERYQRVEQFQIGKRRVVILRCVQP